jgi:RNA polymerase sigma-70 factor (ECF subfamily)
MAESVATRPSLLIKVRDSRDAVAWSQFVDIYAPLIYDFARKKGLQDADAADVTQDVLQAVARALPGLEYDAARGSFRGWLFVITRNRLNNFLTRRHDLTRGSGDTGAMKRLEEQPAPEEERGWEHDYERRLFHWAAEQVKTTVAESTWQAFWQTAVEGKNPKDVARELGVTLAAVYMAKSRLLARIKELIEQVQGDADHV